MPSPSFARATSSPVSHFSTGLTQPGPCTRTARYNSEGITDETVIRFADVAPYGLITTQSCDVVQEGDNKPNTAWVQLAPVFDAAGPHPSIDGTKLLDGGARKLIMQGRNQYRLWIPDLPGNGVWYADLTFEVPVERSWLARRDRVIGFTKEDAREDVGRRLAWLRSRPAFDTRFVAAIQQPIIGALRALRRDHPDDYDRMHEQVFEVGVVLDGRFKVGQAELAVLHAGIEDDLSHWWHHLWVTLKVKADDEGFNLLPLRVVHLNQLSAAEYRVMTRIPLANISPHPGWYGADPQNLPEQ